MIEKATGICKLINTTATPKLCDICKSTAAFLFCRKDTVYLCIACDVTLHSHTKHERVWMCEVCEQSPARVTCKPDAANLCDTCDRNIHSANPLARRHERIPIVPFYDSAAEAVANSTAFNLINQVSDCYENTESNSSVEIPLVTTSIDATSVVMKSMDLFSVSDPFFDFGFAIPTDVSFGSRLHESVNDRVVPVQTTVAPIDLITSSVTNSYKSQSHSELSSSIEAGVVPEENPNSNSNSNSSLNSMILDASNTIMLPVNGRGMNCDKKENKFSAVDREARVLRYKEKRKNRKFEKKIRYASRKAYAETRPRIKGRFVKRTELTTEVDVDRWLLTTLGGSNCYSGEVEYGVVPSF